MLFKFWETILAYFKEKPYWSNIQPIVTVVSLYMIAIILSYQYIEWQYRIAPSLSLYLKSYIFKQITVVFFAVVVTAFIFSFQRRRGDETVQDKARRILRGYIRFFSLRAVALGIVLVVAVSLVTYFSPNKVSHIRVKFLDRPTDFNQYALVYLIYELNILQKNWHFELDFDVFNEDALTSKQREKCNRQDNVGLCYADILAKDKPFIGIASTQLGEDYFWQNRDKVSVISTYGWKHYAPPSIYEFLAFSAIVQSILIHLNTHCKGLPEGSFEISRISHGDLFQFSPRRTEMKAAIMAGHLNRRGEELLLNCFGIEYMTVVSKLLTLDWLHSKKVTRNLKKAFNVNGIEVNQ